MFKKLRTSAAKKWTSLIVTFMMALTIVAPSIPMVVKAAETAGDKVFDIVEITDFHGTLVSSDAIPLPVGGVLAKNIKDLKATNPDRTLIIGGGDLYQGSPISNVLHGVPVQKVLSDLGMEVTAVGNHEFDWQLDTIVNETMVGASYSMVAANLYTKDSNGAKGPLKFDPYKIIEKDGVKIAFIGAITAEAKDIIMPAYTDNFIFTDAATEINAAAAKIKADKSADVIIAIIHAGNVYDSSYKDTGKGEIYDITNKLTNVNAVFGGHSHSIVTGTAANGLPIYIANSSGKGYIDAKMTVKADGTVSFQAPAAADYKAVDTTAANGYKIGNPNLKTTDPAYVPGTPVQDPAAKAIIDAAIAEVGPKFAEVIGTSATDLKRTQLAAPYGESVLGIWASRVVKENAKADIGIANNGGLRTDISAGDITVGKIFYFMPFDNEINTVKVNKAQLKVILEQAVKDGGKGLQMYGVKFTYNAGAATGSRVFNITKEDGTPISDTEVLTLAGPDFILTGGDGFAGFLDPNVSKTMTKTGVLVRDALLADVKANGGINYNLNNRLENSVKSISLIATSDLHGSVLNYDYFTAKTPSTAQGLARVSTYVNGIRANNSNVILADNGDTIQGTPLVYYYNMLDTKTMYPMMAVMGAMKYDTWNLGNHEFNYGLTTLNRIIADAKTNNITVLSANIYNTSGTNYVEPYIMRTYTVNGVTKKVAVIGLTTKNVPGWESPANYAGLKFNDLVDEANYWVPKVKAAGADYVIVTAHSGIESVNDTTPENQIMAVANNVKDIDAIVAGHAHSLYVKTAVGPNNKTVLLTEPGKNGQNISQVDINFDSTGKFVGIQANTVSMNGYADDAAIVTKIKPYQDTTLAYTNEVIGQAADTFEGAKQLTEPSNIMELVNKVQMEAAGTQLSIAAPLNPSATIPKGDVKRQSIMGVYVYENFLYGVKMNGKQLKDWMELSARYYKQVSSPEDPVVKDPVLNVPDYNLDQLYGATYDIDLTQPAATLDSNGRIATGNRIKNLKVNGVLVKDTDVFTVAINNYRYNGGGGFMKAAGLSSTDPSIVTYDSAKALGDDGQVRSLMLKYFEGKTITPTNSNNWKVYTTAVTQETPATPPTTPTIPKTGSPIDMGVLVGFGAAMSGLGALVLILEEKKRRQNNAA